MLWGEYCWGPAPGDGVCELELCWGCGWCMRTVMLVLTVLVWGRAGLLLGSDQGSAAPECAWGANMASRRPKQGNRVA
jgi:hypothetical protein